MNKEKSGGDTNHDLSLALINESKFIDSYREHMSYTGISHVSRNGFFAGGRQLGRSSPSMQGSMQGASYPSHYDMDRAHQEELVRFGKHQERMAAIVAEQEEEDFLILLIL